MLQLSTKNISLEGKTQFVDHESARGIWLHGVPAFPHK